MFTLLRRSALLTAAALVIGVTGCQNVLNFENFELSADAGDGGSTGDSDTDATMNTDGSSREPDAEAGLVVMGDSGPGADGAPESDGQADTGAMCTPGGSCTPSADCHIGEYVCGNSGAVCTAGAMADNGAPCGTDGGSVCNNGTCSSCNAGGDCTDPNMPCARKTYDCSTGTAVCKSAGNVPDNTSCEGSKYCYSGVCSPCTVGAGCAPTSNPCHVGKVTSCAGGTPTCTDQSTAATAGTACTTASVPSGVCDGQSNCVACTPSATCTPSGNPCKSGTMSCSSGPVCNAGSNINEGKTCSTGSICVAGACMACNASTCANGCCDTNGCVASSAQSVNECGTGTGGAACRACTAMNDTPTCSAGKCAIQSCNANFGDCNNNPADGCETNLQTSSTYCGSCQAGSSCPSGGSCSSGKCSCPGSQMACSGTCTDLTSDPKNCGSCGHSCGGGMCTSSACQQWTVASSVKPAAMVSDGTHIIWADITAGAILQKSALGTGSTTTLLTDSSIGALAAWPAGGSQPLPMGISGSTVALATAANVFVVTVGLPTTSAAAKQPFTFPTSGQLCNVALNGAATHVAVMNEYTNSSGQGWEVYDCVIGTSTCHDFGSYGAAAYPVEGAAVTINGLTDYFMDPSDGEVSYFTFGNGTVGTLTAGQTGSAGGVAIDAKNAYWVSTAGIVSEALVGGTVNTLASLPMNTFGVNNIASDGTNVYITTSGIPAVVAYVPATTRNGTATSLASATAPTNVITAGGMVYWLDASAIYGIAAP